MKLYETTDLGIATTLHYFNYQIHDVRRIDSKRVQFTFNDDKNRIEALVNRFWDETIQVTPSAFLSCYKGLKQRIYTTNE